MKHRLFLICPTTEPSGVKTHIGHLSQLKLDNFRSINILYPSKVTAISAGCINIDYSPKFIFKNWLTTHRFMRDFGDKSIIHLHGRLSILAFLPSIIAKRGKFVYTFHQFFNKRNTGFERIKDKLEIFLAKRVLGRVSVSNALAEKMHTDFGVKSITIPNWLPEETYNKPPRKMRPKDERIFMFVGRFSIEKNPMLLLEAAKELVSRGYLNKIQFFGHGPLEKAMLEYINSNKISNTVSMNGTSNKIYDEMHSADCIVIPSLSESFGLVYLEASISNMSSIVAEIPGLNEVTHSTHAIKFAPDEVLSLVEAMIKYLEKSNASVEFEIEEDLRLLASRYGSNNAAILYNKFYNSILYGSMKMAENDA